MTSQGIYYLIRALVALVAIPFHECGHALAAWLLGDDTAKRQGRLSMNPFAHFDLLGTLCMVFAGVGWAKPVSTDPRNFKNPKWGMALTALAGPAGIRPGAFVSRTPPLPADQPPSRAGQRHAPRQPHLHPAQPAGGRSPQRRQRPRRHGPVPRPAGCAATPL